MTGLDGALLWHSFVSAISDLITAIRKMPTWVYGLLLLMAVVANVLAVLLRGGI